jgi:AraC-like DNA-binding protein
MNIFRTLIPPQNNNQFVFSRLENIEFGNRQTPGLGIKYVLSGEENYLIDDREFPVKANRYTLVNDHQQYAAQVNGDRIATGLCIQISNEIINDVHSSLLTKQERLIDDPAYRVSLSMHFINTVSNATACNAGKVLMQLQHYAYDIPSTDFSDEIYYRIAYAFVKENLEVQKQLGNLPAKKTYTREELYRRVRMAKEMIDDSYLQNISMADIAKSVNLSKFYFIQTYKQVFHISPYQYLIKKKLKHAMHLLRYTDDSIYDIALSSGYCDVHAFSKSFKKEFKAPPSFFKQ